MAKPESALGPLSSVLSPLSSVIPANGHSSPPSSSPLAILATYPMIASSSELVGGV
jgi:hypothetical protein